MHQVEKNEVIIFERESKYIFGVVVVVKLTILHSITMAFN